MSRENVEIVAELFESFSRGDYERCFELIDPDVRWEDPREIPGAGVHSGHDGVRAWFARWLAAWDDFSIEADQFTDADEKVIVTERVRGVGKSSGVPVGESWVAVYTLREGRIVARADYADRHDALEGVGLRD